MTTFLEKEIASFTWWGVPIWVYNEHVGTTNTIIPLGSGVFDVKYNTGEDKYMDWNLAGLSNQHMMYAEALASELSHVLIEFAELEVLEDILNAL